MELEHAIGCNVKWTDIARYHPSGSLVSAVGAQVVISNINDHHDQKFLHGHNDFISCLAVSNSYLRPGSKGSRRMCYSGITILGP
ncbi:unnamed protein product [Amoebophrya sp. A25]|nr:unnamed protein product [Amoebophrya sp. A25]|eukprot:GSA25T00023039001.1